MMSLAAMREWDGIGTAPSDTILRLLEEAAVKELEEVTGRLFTTPAAEVVEILDGPETRRTHGLGWAPPTQEPAVWLRESPASVSTVEFRDAPDDAWTAKTLTDFELEGRRLYFTGGFWPAGPRLVRVTYSFGYAEDAAPALARQLVLERVSNALIGEKTRGAKRVKAGKQEVEFFADSAEWTSRASALSHVMEV